MKCGMTQVCLHFPGLALCIPRCHSILYLRHSTLSCVQAWSAVGERVPVTIVELQDLQVCKVRTRMSDGLCALQLGGGWQKRKRMSLAEARQYETRGLAYKQYVREFPVTEDALLPVGTTITARHFVPGQFVDVQAVTRGKGFAGAMKRWGFRGQPASHGASLSHRSVGSMGGAAGSMYATRVWKGKKMPGRMGGRRRTVSGLMVWKVLPKYNLLYLRGSVPGSKGCEVRMRDSLLPKQTFATPPPFPTFLPGDDGDDDMEELLAPLALEVPAVASGKKK
jgi:large subunit ribosomal protein L3